MISHISQALRNALQSRDWKRVAELELLRQRNQEGCIGCTKTIIAKLIEEGEHEFAREMQLKFDQMTGK